MAEQVAQAQRDPAAVDDVRRRAGIEVEGEHRRPLRRPRQRERGVQLERRQLRHPDQRRQAVADAEVDLAGVRAGPTGAVFTHFGRCLGQRFSKKAASRSSTPSGKRRRVTARPRRWGTIAGADLGVVVDDLALGEAGLRVEDLVEVGELQLAPVDLDLAARCPPRYLEDLAWRARRLRFGAALFLAAAGVSSPARLCRRRRLPLTAAMLSSSAAIRSGALVGFGSSDRG